MHPWGSSNAGLNLCYMNTIFPESMLVGPNWLPLEPRHTKPDPYIRQHGWLKRVPAQWVRTSNQKDKNCKETAPQLNCSWYLYKNASTQRSAAKSQPKEWTCLHVHYRMLQCTINNCSSSGVHFSSNSAYHTTECWF